MKKDKENHVASFFLGTWFFQYEHFTRASNLGTSVTLFRHKMAPNSENRPNQQNKASSYIPGFWIEWSKQKLTTI